jgi:4-oxalocrotonate tautomerase
MPVITVQMHKTSPEVKATLIQGLTAMAMQATQLPASAFIVLIQELADENIGIGGKPRTEALAAR